MSFWREVGAGDEGRVRLILCVHNKKELSVQIKNKPRVGSRIMHSWYTGLRGSEQVYLIKRFHGKNLVSSDFMSTRTRNRLFIVPFLCTPGG
jgi:hypothetical protein